MLFGMPVFMGHGEHDATAEVKQALCWFIASSGALRGRKFRGRDEVCERD
jgi:hypothetical protein